MVCDPGTPPRSLVRVAAPPPASTSRVAYGAICRVVGGGEGSNSATPNPSPEVRTDV